MPSKGRTGRWAKFDPDQIPMLFERNQKVVAPSGRVAALTQYWNNPTHEYCGAGSIKYLDNGETAVISLSLLRAWQPGKVYAAPPLRVIRGACVAGPTVKPESSRRRIHKKPAEASKIVDCGQTTEQP